MLAELRTKSQITLPKSIVTSLGLSEGDQFEVYEKDGMICLVPVAVYPKQVVTALQEEIAQLKKDINAGSRPVFTSIDALMQRLENN